MGVALSRPTMTGAHEVLTVARTLLEVIAGHQDADRCVCGVKNLNVVEQRRACFFSRAHLR
jgi:hypothetical protein